MAIAADIPLNAICSCIYDGHDHIGPCSRLNQGDDPFCDYCRFKFNQAAAAAAETIPTAAHGGGGFGRGAFGRRAFGGGRSQVSPTVSEDSFDDGAEAGEGSTVPQPITAMVEALEADDTLEATVTVGGTFDVGGSVDGQVVPPLWHANRFNVFLEIDQAQRELEAVKMLLLAAQADAAGDVRRHNNPPELLGDPGVDVEAVDAALQCLVVLRSLVVQPNPDIEIVRLLLGIVTAILKALGRFIAWVSQQAWSGVCALLNSELGKGFQKGIGGAMGLEAVKLLKEHGPQGLHAVQQMLLLALTTLGAI